MSQHDRVLIVDKDGNVAGGSAAQLDDTDKIAVSLYGNSVSAGDLEVKLAPTGHVIVAFGGSSTATENQSINVVKPGAGSSASLSGLSVHPFVFNGATGDLLRNNEEITLLASAARTAQTDSAAQVNYNHQGMILFVDVTVDPAAASITPTLVVNDPVSGADKIIWEAAAAIAATGQFVYLLLPGAADAGSYTEQKELAIPRDWFFRMTVADADSLTYSVSCCML